MGKDSLSRRDFLKGAMVATAGLLLWSFYERVFGKKGSELINSSALKEAYSEKEMAIDYLDGESTFYNLVINGNDASRVFSQNVLNMLPVTIEPDSLVTIKWGVETDESQTSVKREAVCIGIAGQKEHYVVNVSSSGKLSLIIPEEESEIREKIEKGVRVEMVNLLKGGHSQIVYGYDGQESDDYLIVDGNGGHQLVQMRSDKEADPRHQIRVEIGKEERLIRTVDRQLGLYSPSGYIDILEEEARHRHSLRGMDSNIKVKNSFFQNELEPLIFTSGSSIIGYCSTGTGEVSEFPNESIIFTMASGHDEFDIPLMVNGAKLAYAISTGLLNLRQITNKLELQEYGFDGTNRLGVIYYEINNQKQPWIIIDRIGEPDVLGAVEFPGLSEEVNYLNPVQPVPDRDSGEMHA